MFPGFAPSAIATMFALPDGAVGWKIALVLGLLFFSIVLFAKESVSVDIITFGILIPLIIVGILKPDEAFSGFSSEAVISLAAIFVISGALTSTGVLDLISSRVYKFTGGNSTQFIMPVMLVTAWVSAFMTRSTPGTVVPANGGAPSRSKASFQTPTTAAPARSTRRRLTRSTTTRSPSIRALTRVSLPSPRT